MAIKDWKAIIEATEKSGYEQGRREMAELLDALARKRQEKAAAAQAAADAATNEPPERAAAAKPAANGNDRGKEVAIKAEPEVTATTAAFKAAQQSNGRASIKPENPLDSWNARKEPRAKNADAGPSSDKPLRVDTAVLNGRKDSFSDIRSPKRSAPASGFSDERRQSKKKKSTSNSSSAASTPRSPGELSKNERQPPAWYRQLKFEGSRGREGSDVDVLLNFLKAQVRKAQEGRSDPKTIFNEVRDRLHKIFFLKVTKKGLRNTRILDNESGLPQIFDKHYDKGVEWPFDIRADAEELYNKWCREDFETDLMRGINCGKPKSGKETSDRSSDRLQEGYRTVDSHYHGNGQLLNGQWWPTQLTCLRDGAHGSSQGGISGASIDDKTGAYSCIMSGGHAYGHDEDHGDWVLYCGTDSKDGTGTATESTIRMIQSVGKKPVRLIRSHNLNSNWAPKIGFRYDGLYDVVSKERIDPEGHPRARYRFKLVRCPGQDPIRGGDGPERRPTEQEIEAYEKDKRLRGF